MDIAGKTALVTGGAHRVGRGIVLGLAGAGANIVLHYHSSSDEAEVTASQAREFGVDVELRQANLAESASRDELVAGGVTILVNSAAGFSSDRLRELTREQWDKSMSLNLEAPVFLTQAFAQAVGNETEGAVVNVTDWKTERPYTDPKFSYTISKGALDTFTKVAAAELAPNIRVNAVALGVILPPAGAPDGYAEKRASQIPLERTGGVEVVAKAVVALIENDFITGEIVRLDGGAHLR